MIDFPLLSLVTFLPTVGAAFILLIRGEEEVVARNARWVAMWTTVMTFGASLVIWFWFNPSTAEFQFVEKKAWIGSGINYHMGVDGISMLFVLLTTLLTPLCILASWEAISSRVREYMIAFLIMETMMIGVFCALDFVVFYLFFEGGLIPMFLIIGVWGRRATRLCDVQILPLHPAGVRAHVARDPGDVPEGRYHGYSDVDERRVRCLMAAMVVAGLLRGVRRENSHVAGPHVASRRPCRGTDRGLGDPCRGPAEDRRLRIPQILDPHAAGGDRVLHAPHIRAVRWSLSSTRPSSRSCRRT